MRKLGLALFLAAIPGLAQQPPVSERIEVAVTNVDVTVTGPDGQPIRGLTRDDFEVFEDGRRQPITNFYSVEKDIPHAVSPSTAAAPAADVTEPRFRRKVLVLVDVFNTTKHYRAIALAKLEKMIDDSFETGEYDWSVGVLSRGVTLVLPLTTDKAAVHNAFAKMLTVAERQDRQFSADVTAPAGIPKVAPDEATASLSDASLQEQIDRAMSFDESDRIYRAEFSTRSIIDAVRGFASTPGKKILLLVTGGTGLNDLSLTIDSGGGSMMLPRTFGRDTRELQRRVVELRDAIIREANASGVSIYVMNPEPLEPGGGLGRTPTSGNLTNNSASFWISKDTGGRFVGGNSAANALQQFDVSSSNYYSLGYRSPHGDDGKQHNIEVRLAKPIRASLQYRSSYASAPSEQQLERAMKSPVAAALLPTVLPVSLATGAPQPDARGVALPFSIKVPFSSLEFLPEPNGSAAHVRVYLSVFDDVGKSVYTGAFPLTLRFPAGKVDPNGMMVYRNEVVLSKRTKNQIVAAVRDETTDTIGFASESVQTQ